jgi:hypothetical protein
MLVPTCLVYSYKLLSAYPCDAIAYGSDT